MNDIRLSEIIAPHFYDIHRDIKANKYSEYVLKGGRGTTKSSFISIELLLLLKKNPNMHALVCRKVKDTLKDSVYSQIVWAIDILNLGNEFVCKKSPLEIVYKPTKQIIYFRGADDPYKIKSIKPTFGYIGILWFEELDQFGGNEEIRSIEQSVLRGGDVFYDFKSFNPPISVSNWANNYALTEKANMFSHHSTYLTVPVEWLGHRFIEEAEFLRTVNEKAYRHEYLGEAVGNGGNVFENVSALDMTRLIDTGDEKIPLYKTFSNIYNGLDWGFAKDPTQFVKMHLDNKRHDLYIYDEVRTYGSRNIQIFEELYGGSQPHIKKNELLSYDSAEEKSGADLRAYGAFARGAIKGPDSVHYGIKWLQGLTHIYIDKRRCPHTFKEFSEYEYDRDKDDNIISAYPDRDNHSIDAVRYALEQFYKRKGN